MKTQAIVGMDTILLAAAALTATLVAAAPVQMGQLVTAALFCF